MPFADGNLEKKDVRRVWPWFAELHKEIPGAKSTVPLISVSTVIP